MLVLKKCLSVLYNPGKDQVLDQLSYESQIFQITRSDHIITKLCLSSSYFMKSYS